MFKVGLRYTIGMVLVSADISDKVKYCTSAIPSK